MREAGRGGDAAAGRDRVKGDCRVCGGLLYLLFTGDISDWLCRTKAGVSARYPSRERQLFLIENRYVSRISAAK